MTATTHNCGCSSKSLPLSKRFGSQQSCSPCCFQSFGVSRLQTQCCTQSKKSKTESKLKDLEISKQASTDKIISEIVKKEQPYKEIEAFINDNHVIIRTHKEPIKEEYDPPCECVGQVAAKESTLSQRKCENGVAFDMTHGNLELCRASREEASSLTKKTCEETGCRTVTLYPNIKESREVKRSKMTRSIDLEENPNIFLLRIRKQCNSGDKKQTIDLEFRAPRPWRKKELKSEILEKHEDDTSDTEEHENDEEHYTDNENNDIEH